MNKTINLSLFIFISLTILITAFIFSNSLKNGEESNAQSEPIVEAVETILDPKDEVPTKTFNYIVRKAAHITEFTMLGLTLAGMMWCMNGRIGHGNKPKRIHEDNRRQTATGLLTGLMIAAADEIIQSFTGRTSSVTDVLIDFTGVALGMTIWLMIQFIRMKRSKPEES